MIISLSVVPFNVCRDLNTLRKSNCFVSLVNRRLVNVCPVLKSCPVLRSKTWKVVFGCVDADGC